MFSDLVKIQMSDTSENGAPEKAQSRSRSPRRPVNYLRGTIAEELVDGNDFVGKDSIQLLKHHGTYQQDDRERRC